MLDYGLNARDFDRLETLPGLDADRPAARHRAESRSAATSAPTPTRSAPRRSIFDVINLRLARGQFFDQLQYDRGRGRLRPRLQGRASNCSPTRTRSARQIRVGTTGRGTVDADGHRRARADRPARRQRRRGMMQRDLDQDIYFPLTLARDVFGDIDHPHAGRHAGAQADRADRGLAAGQQRSTTSSACRASRREPGRHRQKGGRRRSDFEVKAPIQILRNAERLKRDVQLHHGRHRQLLRWSSAGSGS